MKLYDLSSDSYDEPEDRLSTLISAINGYPGQGLQWRLTEYTNDSDYTLRTRNKGTDGLAFAAYTSTADLSTASPIVQISDLGLVVDTADFAVYDGANLVVLIDNTGLTIGAGYSLDVLGSMAVGVDLTVGHNLTVTNSASILNDLAVSDDVLIGGDLTVQGINVLYTATAGQATDIKNTNSAGNSLLVRRADNSGALVVAASTGLVTANFGVATTTVLASSTVTGGQLISTAAGGTAPLVVTSLTVVTNLNADLLDGMHSGTTHDTVAFYDSNTRVVDSNKLNGLVSGSGAGNVAVYDGNIRVIDSAKLGGKVLGTTTDTVAFYDGNTRVADSNKLNGLVSGNSSGQVAVNNGTLNSNLNADMTDGLHASNASGAIGVNNGTINANSVANYLGASGQGDVYFKARSNHTGTQTPGTISPQGSGSGLDADTLDGSDSSAFAGSGHDHDSRYVNESGDTMSGALEVNNNLTAQEFDCDGSGTVLNLTGSSQTQSTVGGAGSASALPATPKGYWKMKIGGNDVVVPYYNPV